MESFEPVTLRENHHFKIFSPGGLRIPVDINTAELSEIYDSLTLLVKLV